MDPQATHIAPGDAPAEAPPRAPMTLREAWAVSLGAGLFLLFALACAAIAFDLPTLRHTLDVRALFR